MKETLKSQAIDRILGTLTCAFSNSDFVIAISCHSFVVIIANQSRVDLFCRLKTSKNSFHGFTLVWLNDMVGFS